MTELSVIEAFILDKHLKPHFYDSKIARPIDFVEAGEAIIRRRASKGEKSAARPVSTKIKK